MVNFKNLTLGTLVADSKPQGLDTRKTAFTCARQRRCSTKASPDMGRGLRRVSTEARLFSRVYPRLSNPLDRVRESSASNRSSMMTGTDDTPIGVASLRDALDRKNNPNLTFTASSSPENTGLCLVASFEVQDPEPLIASAAALLYSPMFWLLVAEFQTSTQGTISYAENGNNDNAALSLRLLCARMFLAGVYAQKLEAGAL